MSKKIFLTLFASIISFSVHAQMDDWDLTPPSVCCSESLFYFGGEGLWWTVNQNNLDYGVDVPSEDEEIRDELVGSGNTHYLSYDWKAGGRGWLGFSVGCGWDVRGVYTWFEDCADGQISRPHKATLIHPATEDDKDEASHAHGKNDINYQVADLLFGRNIYFCCDTFMMEPFIGVRGIKLDQELEVTYDGIDFEDSRSLVSFDSELKAIGLNLGLDLNYDFCDYLGLYGGFGGSILYGKGDHQQYQYLLDDNGDIIETEVSIHDELFNIIPGYNLRAGFMWHICNSHCLNLVMRGGYEFNHWFNTPQVRRFYDSNHEGVSSSITDGQITFHGATLSLTILF